MAETISNGVTQEEMEMAFSGPSIFVNKLVVLLNEGGVRIAFAETYAPDRLATFRAAVTLAPTDAIALRDVLNHVLQVVEPQLAAARAAAAANA